MPASPSRSPRGEESRLRLIRAAEVLFATRGFEVPNREIVEVAGQRNRSAIQYHFGSRAGLLEQIWALRGEPINRHRDDLVARLPRTGSRTTRQLVDAYLDPLVTELTKTCPSYWARFEEMVLRDQPLVFTVRRAADDDRSGGRVEEGGAPNVFCLLVEHLSPLPEPDAAARVALTVRFLISSLARWERDYETDAGCVPPLVQVAMILAELAVAMLDAPMPLGS